jgi:hypothetical protein
VSVEQFVARVFQGEKMSVPKRIRKLLDVRDGDYVKLQLLFTLKICILRLLNT